MMSAQNSLTGVVAGILQLFEADVMMGSVADVLSMGTVVMALTGSTVRPRAVVSDFRVVSTPGGDFELGSVFVCVFFMFLSEVFVSGMFVSFMFSSVFVFVFVFVIVAFIPVSGFVLIVFVFVIGFVSVISISIVLVIVISVMLISGSESCDFGCDSDCDWFRGDDRGPSADCARS